ncbi:hypothetical protein HB778_38525 (plasmid) [Mesorhizobium huakuii]|uniref:3-methyl-2-oxobutanoate hydroxymethyltransferase n=2 Tax=Mesorhizobium TaxID=68287 RepID=A0A7G6T5I6_9HYPH|nr:hypothetical protein HB778_38525 [Mesorhizobium huakuii]
MIYLPLSGLSSVGGKSVIARFDGGMLSSNSGVLALAEVEKRLRVADRLARCIDDPRWPDQVVHSLADMIGFRMKMIAAITAEVAIPTIGIGASAACDGQILVVDDMLGTFGDFRPKFVKRCAELGEIAGEAIAAYAQEVRDRRFPGSDHVFGDAPRSVNGEEAG